jgi:Cu-processing system permease protein
VVLFYKSYLYVLLLSFRGGFLKVGLYALVALIVGVYLAASFSGRQPATVGLDIGFSIIRLVLPFTIALAAQDLVGREIDRRYYLLSLSYPSSRIYFLITRFAVMAVLSMLLLAALGLSLALLIFLVGEGYSQVNPVNLNLKYGLVLVSIYTEALVVVAVSQLIAVVSRTPGFVIIGVLGFTLIGRSYVAIINLILRDASVVDDSEAYSAGLGMLRYLLPDLGGLDVREIALYDQWALLPSVWGWSVLAYLLYMSAFLFFGFLVFKYKRFN